MLLKNSTLLLLFMKGILSLVVDEAFVETEDSEYEVSDNNEVSDSFNVDSRTGKLLKAYPYSPIVDMVMQTQSAQYFSHNNRDVFGFLRDSYPLPGGLKEPLQEYDFVVIGAGSAGSVVASRLTEDRNTTVLLLESGRPEMLLTDVPALAPYFQSTDYTWQYYMEHQPGVCRGMIKERCFWPRGKAVGGTSVINYMIYTRGRPQDWDRIAAAGNYGWSYEDVLRYYKKSEKADLNGYEKTYHRSRDGILPVEFVPLKTKLINAFLEAGEILGHPTVDYNAPETLGFGKVQVNQLKGHRQSAAKIFLHTHKKRKNLHIMPETPATRILINPETKTAYGVEYVRNNRIYAVSVRKEVILSAGPIASPQLLMLSGVGPKQHLMSKEIPVIQDLPVGKTLYDHICFPGLIFTLNKTGVSFSENRALSVRSVTDWLRDGDSVLASPGGVEGIGYIKTPVSDDPEPVPDIELISIGGSILSDGGRGGSRAVRKGMRLDENIFNKAYGAIDDTDTWSAFPMLLHPRSVGYIELKDDNPFNHPKMVGNFLTDKKDVATFVAAIRHIQALVETKPFKKLGAKVYPAKLSTCKGIEFDSDEYWECALRTYTATLHHQIATCRMGPVGDPQAVVDPELRVHGVQRLRVVDSSVIPRTVSAHTNAPAIMIGEKGADLIKATWGIPIKS